jgi:hypothetical protein
MNRSEVGRRRYRVEDHRQVEAELARRLPKLTQNPLFWTPNYENICLATSCSYDDSALFTTLFKIAGPFRTLVHEVEITPQITGEQLTGITPVPLVYPRAQRALVSESGQAQGNTRCEEWFDLEVDSLTRVRSEGPNLGLGLASLRMPDKKDEANLTTLRWLNLKKT